MSQPPAAVREEYFRGDRAEGVTPPDLSKDCTFSEHVVRARGKRTRFTSVSKDHAKIRDLGDTVYQVRRDPLSSEGHGLVEHEALVKELRRVAREGSRGERARANQALRYATRRLEGLVDWRFNVSAVEQKDLINWAYRHIQPYFQRL